MEIIWWIIIGGLAGALAKLIMPGKDPGGCIVTVLLGIAGAFVGGWLGGALGLTADTGPAGFIGAVIGAIILLAIYRLVVGRRTV
ncbi:MAG: GlsB/YeaQ/YmgE family stress response membrane protein [Longimicrobiaceae bacterium]